MTSKVSAEEINDEETVARAGDSGPLHSSQESDPWSTGEMELLRVKWLQKEIDDHAQKEELLSSSQRSSHSFTSLPRTRSTIAARLSRSSRSNSLNDHVIEIRREASEREHLSVIPSIFELTSTRKSDSQTENVSLNSWIEYPSTLAHLAFFGIIGVLIRYGLEVLFDDVLSVTREGTILYKDLPANVVGSFFMGWVGIVWKKDISQLSEPMAIGLSTGLMGSITTYAAWNQAMVALLTTGDVGAALSGLLLGMAVAQMSLLAGIDSARGIKTVTAKLRGNQSIDGLKNSGKWLNVNLGGGLVSAAVIAFATACLWAAALVLLIRSNSSQKLSILWLACLVAPPGVWARWHLARFNGKGIRGRLRWLPVGTLLTNLTGASLEAVLSLLEFVVTKNNASMVIGGLQLGFIGCLSTVSTFTAEVYTMHVGLLRLKSYIYSMLTLGLGLVISALLYSCPSLAKGYVEW